MSPENERRRRRPGRRREDQELAKLLARQLRFRRITAETLLPLAIAVALVVLLMGAGLSVVTFRQQQQLERQHRQDVAANVLRDRAVFGSCERLQLVRDDVNVISSAVYRVLVMAQRAANSEQSRVLFESITRSAIYLPPTDCAAAVRHADTYRPPRPVPFSTVAQCFNPGNLRPDPGCPRHGSP